MTAFRADRLAGDEADPTRRTQSAAIAATRRVIDALEIAQQRDRHPVGAPQFDDLAEPAAITPGAARALAEFATAEHNRRDRLGHFDRDRAHAGRKGGDIESVLPGPRAGAAAMKDDRAERRDIAVLSGAEFIEHIGAAIDLWVPQRGGALGWHAARHDMMQATKHDIGQHVADGVTCRDGARPFHIEET